MVHWDVQNRTEMGCLKVNTQQGLPPLGDAHLSRHHWPLFIIPLSGFPSSAGAITQIGSYEQTYQEERLEVEKVGIRVGQ